MGSLHRGWRVLVTAIALFPCLSHAWQQCLEEAGEQRFRCLATYEVNNTGDTAYEMALAESASQAGNPAYATVVLERVVERDPSNAGARLDLVILSLAAGDQFTAKHHLEVLQTLPDPPLVVGELLRRLDRQINPLAEADSKVRPRFTGSLGLGYDDNPNFGITADTIDLLIDGGPLTLIPADSMMPDPAAFAMGSVQIDYPYSKNGGLQALVGLRQYDGQSDNDSLSTSARIHHRLAGNRYVEAVLADFRMRDGLYLTRAGVGGNQRFGQCRCNSAGVKLDYMEGNESSLSTTRLRLELDKVMEHGPLALYLYGSVDYSYQPNAEWGNTAGFIVGADALAFSGPLTWVLGVSHSNSYDDSPYSPLFGSDRRDLQWQQLKAGVAYGITRGTELFVDWSYMQQNSSIPLYDFNRHVANLGIRTAF